VEIRADADWEVVLALLGWIPLVLLVSFIPI